MAFSFATVIPVGVSAARAWSFGHIGDYELIDTARRSPPWAIYFADLPNRAAWRTVPPPMAALAPGASAFICRTSNPVVLRWCAFYDMELVITDPGGSARLWAGPERTAVFLAPYAGRMAQNSAAASGVTSSR